MVRHLVITGLMGVGKSTTAQAVADTLARPCHDSDRDLEALFGCTGAELAAEHGVTELHRLESAVLLGRLASDTPAVISAAASIVEDGHCQIALGRRAMVVVLSAPVDEIVRRASTNTHRRTMTRHEVETLAERRRPFFQATADLELDATQPTATLVDAILAEFA